LFTQEINVKEETFGISSSSISREDHEARQESRHVMNMTPNDPEDQSVNVQVFKDSTRKQRSLQSKDSSLNREGNDVKGPHASVHK
jgi:hypothetical protein